MSARPPRPNPRLPDQVSGARSTLWWGMLLFLVILAVIVASFIFSYLYLRGTAPQWPPRGIEPPPLLVPSLASVLLLFSAGSIFWAERGIRLGNQARLRLGLLVSMGLALVFQVLVGLDYAGRGFSWETHAYGSMVWAMSGFHAALVGLGLLLTGAVLVLAWQGHFGERRRVAVQGTALYWYFMVAAWVSFFAAIYLSPRLV